MATLISESGTDLAINGVQILKNQGPKFGSWPHARPMCDGAVDHAATYTTGDAEFFDFDRASIVFASSGLQRTKHEAYKARVDALRHTAVQDGYLLGPASESDFWSFVLLERCLRKGNLVLMDNGNLRAIWKDGQETRLGVQFLGHGTVQYVIFKRREAMLPISRVAGRDTFEGLKRQIDAFDLRPLFYE